MASLGHNESITDVKWKHQLLWELQRSDWNIDRNICIDFDIYFTDYMKNIMIW